MGLFTPKYLSKDICKAIKAVKELNDQRDLAVAAQKHPSYEVRVEAVKRLTDLPSLERIMQTDPSMQVRLAAMKTDSRLDQPIYSAEELAVVENIHPSDEVLFSVALHDSYEIVRQSAMYKIQSHDLVSRLAVESADKELAKMACVHFLSLEHYFGYCSGPRNPDQGKVIALYKATPHQSVRWAITDNLRSYPDLIRQIALSDNDFANFKRIVEKTDSAEEARAITEARGQSLPVCPHCHRPAFWYYRFGNDRICCWECINFDYPHSYRHTHKDVAVGIDIPAGRYMVLAVGTREEGEEVRQVRNGEVFESTFLTSQYNEDGIPGRMEFDFLEGDRFEGTRCGFQQKEVQAELVEINDWLIETE